MIIASMIDVMQVSGSDELMPEAFGLVETAVSADELNHVVRVQNLCTAAQLFIGWLTASAPTQTTWRLALTMDEEAIAWPLGSTGRDQPAGSICPTRYGLCPGGGRVLLSPATGS